MIWSLHHHTTNYWPPGPIDKFIQLKNGSFDVIIQIIVSPNLDNYEFWIKISVQFQTKLSQGIKFDEWTILSISHKKYDF